MHLAQDSMKQMVAVSVNKQLNSCWSKPKRNTNTSH